MPYMSKMWPTVKNSPCELKYKLMSGTSQGTLFGSRGSSIRISSPCPRGCYTWKLWNEEKGSMTLFGQQEGLSFSKGLLIISERVLRVFMCHVKCNKSNNNLKCPTNDHAHNRVNNHRCTDLILQSFYLLCTFCTGTLHFCTDTLHFALTICTFCADTLHFALTICTFALTLCTLHWQLC